MTSRRKPQLAPGTIVERYIGGASMTSISRSLGVDRGCVSGTLKRAGVTIRSASETLKGNRHARRFSVERDTLYDLYATQKKTVREIAIITGCTNVFLHMKAAGIPMRGTAETRIGKPPPISPEGMARIRLANTGVGNRMWKGGILSPHERNYQRAEWRHLRAEVLARDNFTCQSCQEGFSTRRLRAHHLRPRRYDGPDTRDNLITLCNPCHCEWHIMLDGLHALGRTPW